MLDHHEDPERLHSLPTVIGHYLILRFDLRTCGAGTGRIKTWLGPVDVSPYGPFRWASVLQPGPQNNLFAHAIAEMANATMLRLAFLERGNLLILPQSPVFSGTTSSMRII